MLNVPHFHNAPTIFWEKNIIPYRIFNNAPGTLFHALHTMMQKGWRRQSVGGVLVDDFKDYSIDIVKEHAKSFKSGNDSDNEEVRH